MVRERGPARASAAQRFELADVIDNDLSRERCAEFYPDAVWVGYEILCALPDFIIGLLAEWLDVEPWAMPEPIVTSPNTTVGVG